MARSAERPFVPYGSRIELPGRGTTFVRAVEGPPGAPTVLLLHGWTATGGLNWVRVFEPLSEHFNVLAPDLRGHGRGVRTRRRFRLADCADDCAATLGQLRTGPVIAVGYSMGGPVAKLLLHRHADLVQGLVLCATSACFVPDDRQRVLMSRVMGSLAGSARVAQATGAVAAGLGLYGLTGRRRPELRQWAEREMARHDWRMVAQAGRSIARYDARHWIDRISVPTAVVLTTRDQAVPPAFQADLVRAIPGATVHPYDGDHLACTESDFVPVLLDACRSVAARATASRRPVTR